MLKDVTTMKNILNLYMFLPLFLLIVGVIYVFTASDTYRYACQDPVNWQNEECNPPLCQASGACTKDLISNGEDIVTQLENMKQIEEALTSTPSTEQPIDQPIDQLVDEINSRGIDQ